MVARVAGVFDERLTKAIANSKILVVGAGGIGCEILKNLVLTGFPYIEIVSNHYILSHSIFYYECVVLTPCLRVLEKCVRLPTIMQVGDQHHHVLIYCESKRL